MRQRTSSCQGGEAGVVRIRFAFWFGHPRLLLVVVCHPSPPMHLLSRKLYLVKTTTLLSPCHMQEDIVAEVERRRCSFIGISIVAILRYMRLPPRPQLQLRPPRVAPRQDSSRSGVVSRWRGSSLRSSDAVERSGASHVTLASSASASSFSFLDQWD